MEMIEFVLKNSWELLEAPAMIMIHIVSLPLLLIVLRVVMRLH
jgi:hypothetical protein